MQAPTPEFTDMGAPLFAGVMLELRQYVKGHTLSSLLVHIAKPLWPLLHEANIGVVSPRSPRLS